jgi:hypothetical protein
MSMTPCGNRDGIHSYPKELVSFLLDHWDEPDIQEEEPGIEGTVLPDKLPDAALLEQLISTCYQASLMREEERPVNFRLIVREPHRFDPDQGPPSGLHRLPFAAPRTFSESELRRLSPAADFYRSLLGVCTDPVKGLQIWGIVHSGARWTQLVHGGRKTASPLPPSLVIYVTGPGRIAVCRGSLTIASLVAGQISCPSRDIFNSVWLPENFAESRSELLEMHQAERRRAKAAWANLEPDFIRTLAQQVVKRIISTIRNSRHGGTLVYLPAERAAELCCKDDYMSVKYQFTEEEPRRRFRTLLVRVMNTFAEISADPADPGKVVGWNDYVNSPHEEIAHLDEALFEVAHLIAGLAAIDGAVILSKRHELLGFGAVISGDIDRVAMVARALDSEGEQTVPVLSEEVGTRHRAAYRLCYELHDAIAIVISQDGTVRLIKWHNGQVTYWDHVPSGVLGF